MTTTSPQGTASVPLLREAEPRGVVLTRKQDDRDDAQDEVRDQCCSARVFLRDPLTEEQHQDVECGEFCAVEGEGPVSTAQ